MFTISSELRWRRALEAHDAAVTALIEAATAIPAERWTLPRAPGKWSPAEIVEHLCRAYETLQAELAGAPGMALRTRAWQRFLLRWTVRPRLLAGAAFPRGVPAPRETRPLDVQADPAAGIERFTRCAHAFRDAAEEASLSRPGARLTHAYFGAMPLEEAIRFSAVHARHHTGQLVTGAACN